MCDAAIGCNQETCQPMEGYVCDEVENCCSQIFIDPTTNECLDGNTVSGDGLDSDCVVEVGFSCSAIGETSEFSCSPICGDGLVIEPEQCDDLNLLDGDGCCDSCETELGFDCEEPEIGEPSVCSSLCGDGI